MHIQLYKGVLTRNYMDRYIVDEMDGQYSKILEKCQGKVVLDVGANIGAFTLRALERGALLCVSVEPEAGNFRMLEMNTEMYTKLGKNVQIDRAVSNTSNDIVTLYVNSGNNQGLHSIIPDWFVGKEKQHTEQKVLTVSFIELLNVYKPQIVKIDIEGSEIAIQDTIRNIKAICPSVEYIAVEFDTFNNDTNYIGTLNELTKSFKDMERNKFFMGEAL